jgi:hypothetical protein
MARDHAGATPIPTFARVGGIAAAAAALLTTCAVSVAAQERDTLVLEYQPDPEHGAAGTLESFYFAKGAGWFLWTRSDGVRVAFNRIGGVARPSAPYARATFRSRRERAFRA